MSYVDRTKELKRYFPEPFYKLKDGQGLSVLLEVFGSELNTLDMQAANAREQFLLAKAVGKYLEVHGVNMDVFKPRGYKMKDQTYRELIKIVTNSPKNIERIFERILKLYFGDTCIETGLANVYSYRPNEMIVELQANALIIASSRDLYGTCYLHSGHGASSPGNTTNLWSGTLGVSVSTGATSVTLPVVPTGMPTLGILVFGDSSTSSAEIKGYSRAGNVVTFYSPVSNDYPTLQQITGPKFPDDYHSGYVYDKEYRTDLVGSYIPGATSLLVSAVNAANIPVDGTVFIGNPLNANFEAKGYTKTSLLSTTLNLKGPLAFAHSSGDPVIPPCFHRKIRTQLNQSITAGASFSEIDVISGADFPTERGAIKLASSFGNEELVPFISRKLSDNGKLLIDPGYTFRFDHAAGEKTQLMARRTSVDINGLQWPFYLNDTDSLRAQFFNLLRRLKATGVKIVFELL